MVHLTTEHLNQTYSNGDATYFHYYTYTTHDSGCFNNPDDCTMPYATAPSPFTLHIHDKHTPGHY
jgi:hypothetical protein